MPRDSTNIALCTSENLAKGTVRTCDLLEGKNREGNGMQGKRRIDPYFDWREEENWRNGFSFLGLKKQLSEDFIKVGAPFVTFICKGEFLL